MAKQSTQHKLDRVRPPRVHVTYDVEIGDAIEMKELPFVMGVLGDFSGQPSEALPRLRDRKFTEVTPDNFDSVLEGMKPRLAFEGRFAPAADHEVLTKKDLATFSSCPTVRGEPVRTGVGRKAISTVR